MNNKKPTYLLIVLLIITIIVLLKILENPSNGAKGRLTDNVEISSSKNKDRVLFKSIAGCDSAKKEVAEIVDFLRYPKKYQDIGSHIPKGILMIGPPGTGKTLLAKAVAGEADVPFFSISGSDFVEIFVGVGASRVRDMFEQGRKNAPCIIFIDEIDAVGRKRVPGVISSNDEREQTLNSLLVEMDGFNSYNGIIIMAATNRSDVLDRALLRRFERIVIIDLPDLIGRKEILQVHATKIKIRPDIDFQQIASITAGFSGADLANILNEAAIIAASLSKTEVDMCDIEEALDKIKYGIVQHYLMDEEDKYITAYHEAGHALVQAYINDPNILLHKVTIVPRGNALGMTILSQVKNILVDSKSSVLNKICVAMAGSIGEVFATGESTNGACSDIQQATSIARHMVCNWGMSELGPVALGDNQLLYENEQYICPRHYYSEYTARKIDAAINRIIIEQYNSAKHIIMKHHKALVVIAQSLLRYDTIEGKHIYEILQHGKICTEVKIK